MRIGDAACHQQRVQLAARTLPQERQVLHHHVLQRDLLFHLTQGGQRIGDTAVELNGEVHDARALTAELPQGIAGPSLAVADIRQQEAQHADPPVHLLHDPSS